MHLRRCAPDCAFMRNAACVHVTFQSMTLGRSRLLHTKSEDSAVRGGLRRGNSLLLVENDACAHTSVGVSVSSDAELDGRPVSAVECGDTAVSAEAAEARSSTLAMGAGLCAKAASISSQGLRLERRQR